MSWLRTAAKVDWELVRALADQVRADNTIEMSVSSTGQCYHLSMELGRALEAHGYRPLMAVGYFLLDRAPADGFTGLVAEVLPSNHDMLDLLASSGRELHSTTVGGIRSVRITLPPPTGAPGHPSPAADPEADLGQPGTLRSGPGSPGRPARWAS